MPGFTYDCSFFTSIAQALSAASQHDSLVPLAVCAAALFLWRSEVLLCCKDKAEVEGVFGSGQLHRIRIVPLLQSFLFLEEFKG